MLCFFENISRVTLRIILTNPVAVILTEKKVYRRIQQIHIIIIIRILQIEMMRMITGRRTTGINNTRKLWR